jgi:putative transposase
MVIIDWYLRRVLSWRISKGMETAFCIDYLEDVLRSDDNPEIFNIDTGSQFTSKAFADVLLEQWVTISMDGRDRVFDTIFVERLWRNVIYEAVYLKGNESMVDLGKGLSENSVFILTQSVILKLSVERFETKVYRH